MIKYKPCCEKKCGLGTCSIRDEGGCYCLCRLFDHLSVLKSVINGHTIYVEGAFVYYPDKDKVKEYLNKIDGNTLKEHEGCLKNIPVMVIEIEKRIKEYEE